MSHIAETDVDLIIVGASARAAAFSALRAGFHPLCIDLFADTDLQEHALVRTVADYPSGILTELKNWPELPVMYVGGLENFPDILQAIAQSHPLWGNTAEAVARVRNLSNLAAAARLSRVQFPEFRDSQNPPLFDEAWLLRPHAGAGGKGITPWTEAAASSPVLLEPHYFQKRIAGDSYSATFIAGSAPGDVRFVGVMAQLIGDPRCHARPFQWCGNFGPVSLPVETEILMRRFGNVLKWKLGLLGIYGVDWIVDTAGIPWVTEVNPRYPASVELLEHVTGIPLLREHCRAFAGDDLPETSWNQPHPQELLAKAVLYSPISCQLDQPIADPALVSPLMVPTLTDLPPVGARFRAGDPVCTVFAESMSAEVTMQMLTEQLTLTTNHLLASSTAWSESP